MLSTELLGGNDSRGFSVWPSLAVASAATLLIVWAIWLPRRWTAVALLGILAIGESIYWQHRRIDSLVERDAMFYPAQRDTVMRQQPDFSRSNSRDSLLAPNSALYRLEPQINGYDPLQLNGFAELVAPDGGDAFWRGGVEVGRWSDRPYLLMKRAFWLHREVLEGEIPPRGELFPIATTAYLSDPESLHVPVVSAASVPARPFSGESTQVQLIDALIELTAEDGSLESSVSLALPEGLSGDTRTLRIVASSESGGELEVLVPEKTEQRAASLCASIRIPPRTDRREYFVPLPDGEYGLLEFSTFFANLGDSLTLNEVEIVEDSADEHEHIQIVHRSPNSVTISVENIS